MVGITFPFSPHCVFMSFATRLIPPLLFFGFTRIFFPFFPLLPLCALILWFFFEVDNSFWFGVREIQNVIALMIPPKIRLLLRGVREYVWSIGGAALGMGQHVGDVFFVTFFGFLVSTFDAGWWDGWWK